jgi:hypothetical protein
MKQNLAFTYLLLTIVSLVLTVGDSFVPNDTFSKHLYPINKECSAPTDLLVDSHMGSIEDEEIATVSKAKSCRYCPFLGLVPPSDTAFNSYFSTDIWQPPKLS